MRAAILAVSAVAAAASGSASRLRLVAVLPAPAAIVGNGHQLFVSSLASSTVYSVNAVSGATMRYAGTGTRAPASATTAVLAAALSHAASVNPLNTALVNPVGLGISTNGSLYIGDARGHVLHTPVNVVGGPMTSVIGTSYVGLPREGRSASNTSILPPTALAVDRHGALYLGDSTGRVTRVSDGRVSTVLGGGGSGSDVPTGCFAPSTIPGSVGNGAGLPATSAVLGSVGAIVFDRGSGRRVFVSDPACGLVRSVGIATSGVPQSLETIAGSALNLAPYTTADEGVRASSVALSEPRGIAVTAAGHLIVAEAACIRLVRDCDRGIVTLAGYCGKPGMSLARIQQQLNTSTIGSGEVDPLSVYLQRPSGLWLSSDSKVLYFTDTGLGAVFSMTMPTIKNQCTSADAHPKATTRPATANGAAGVKNGASTNSGSGDSSSSSGGSSSLSKKRTRGIASLCGHGGKCYNYHAPRYYHRGK